MHARDLPAFATYLEERQALRPPDHLAVEWYAKETDQARASLKDRVLVSTRNNLFLHIGKVSTLRHKRSSAHVLPECWEQLKPPIVFKVEAFRDSECPNDEIWPCPPEAPNSRPVLQAGATYGSAVVKFAPSSGTVDFDDGKDVSVDKTRSTTLAAL
jgi:hypothetical protein